MQTQISEQKPVVRINEQTIRDASLTYKPKAEELNISELDSIPVDIKVWDKPKKKQDGTPYVIKVFELEGKLYRMPLTVLRDLKAMLGKKPHIQTFAVLKEGEGNESHYTVMPGM